MLEKLIALDFIGALTVWAGFFIWLYHYEKNHA